MLKKLLYKLEQDNKLDQVEIKRFDQKIWFQKKFKVCRFADVTYTN